MSVLGPCVARTIILWINHGDHVAQTLAYSLYKGDPYLMEYYWMGFKGVKQFYILKQHLSWSNWPIKQRYLNYKQKNWRTEKWINWLRSSNMCVVDLGLNSRFTCSRDWAPILKLHWSWTADLFHEIRNLMRWRNSKQNGGHSSIPWKWSSIQILQKIIARSLGLGWFISGTGSWNGLIFIAVHLTGTFIFSHWTPIPRVLMQRKRIPLFTFYSYLALPLISKQNCFLSIVSPFHWGKML